MPRPHVWPPTIHRHCRGQAYIRVKGVVIWLGPHGSDRAAARYAQVVAELTAKGHHRADSPPPLKRREAEEEASVAVVVARWWAEEVPRYAADSREPESVRGSCRPLLALYASLPAAELDAEKLETVGLAMATGSWLSDKDRARYEKYRLPITMHRKTVNRALGRIKTVWRWAERKGLVPRGSWEHLRTLRGFAITDGRVRPERRRQPVYWPQVKAAALKAPPSAQLMILLQWWSGMRSGEVRQMKAQEIDTSGDVWLYTPATHKNAWRGQSRVIALGPRCQALLRSRLLSLPAPEGYLFSPDGRRGRSQRSHYTSYGYAQAVHRACLRAKVVPWQPYDLRHAAKTRIVRELGLDAARAVLGQKALSTTNEYGEALDAKQAADVMRRLG